MLSALSLWWVPATAEGENQMKDVAAATVTLIFNFFFNYFFF